MAREWFIKEKRQAEIELGLRNPESEGALALEWTDVPGGDAPYKSGSMAVLPTGWTVSIVPSTIPPIAVLSPGLSTSLPIREYKEKFNDSSE